MELSISYERGFVYKCRVIACSMFHVWLNSIQQTAIKKVSDRPLRKEGELHVTLHENSFILAGVGG